LNCCGIVIGDALSAVLAPGEKQPFDHHPVAQPVDERARFVLPPKSSRIIYPVSSIIHPPELPLGADISQTPDPRTKKKKGNMAPQKCTVAPATANAVMVTK